MPEPGERAVARAEETADSAPATDPSVDPIAEPVSEPVVEPPPSPAVPMLLQRAGPPAALLAAAWAAMVGLLVLTGQGVTHSAAVASLDRQITSWVVAHRTPALDRWMAALTFTGSWLAALGVAAVVAVLAWRRRVPPRDLVTVLAGWAGVALAVPVTKSLVQRPRPPEPVRLLSAHGWSFPSGHTATAVVVFGTATTITVLLVHRRAVRALALAACPLLVGVIAFSRVELGVHWTTDVAASVVWTAGWLLVCTVVAQLPEVTTRGLPGHTGGLPSGTGDKPWYGWP
jgi:undecaprenyl-diphosphatase